MEDMEEQPPKVMESLLLSVSHFWSVRETANRQVELIEQHFRQDKMLAAWRELATLVAALPPSRGRQEPQGRPPGPRQRTGHQLLSSWGMRTSF